MCTAAAYRTSDFYFGRTMDLDRSFGEEIIVTPRNYPLTFRQARALSIHYAIIGTAIVQDGYPLYYDGLNEKGLSMAGLNFVGNAVYHDALPGKDNIAQFEFTPWILGQCASVKDARRLLSCINLTPVPFRENFFVAQLHWIIADQNETIVVEPMASGVRVYDDPAEVLTNNPPFPQQLFQLNNYITLSPRPPVNNFSDRLELQAYSHGIGAIGLPGDLSSQSRFARAAFHLLNSYLGDSEQASVSQLFHVLGAVSMPRGSCILESGQYYFTVYTSCCNTSRGIYYYTTYNNPQISAVQLFRCDLSQAALIRFPMLQKLQVHWQN